MKHQKTTNSKFKLKKYFTGTDGIKDENNAKFKTGAAISNSMITALPSIINDVRNDSVSNNYNINQNGLTPLEEKKNIGGMALKYGVSGASMGSAAGPWGAAIGGAVGAIGGASYGLISNNKIEKKNTILQNVNKIKTEALKQQNTDVEQIGYAKKGLDLTKYKKYDDGTKSIKPKSDPIPKYTPDEVQLLNKYKNYPEEYKTVSQRMIGYQPKPGRGAVMEENQKSYVDSVNRFNSRDVSKSYKYDFTDIDDLITKKDTNNNINRIKNIGLDRFAATGGYVSPDSNIYQKDMSIVKPKPIYKDKQPRAMIYKKGTKAVEVEGDEILMAKDKGKFKLKQDFKGGPTHEQGGIPIIAEEGDIIYPANKRKQVVEAVEDNNHKKLESIRKTLPSDTKYKKYNGDNGVGLGYKSKSKYKINTSKLGISASDYAERRPNVISSFDNYKSEKLDLGGYGAGDGTTPAALQGLTSKLTRGYKMNSVEPIMGKLPSNNLIDIGKINTIEPSMKNMGVTSLTNTGSALKSPGSMTKVVANPDLGKKAPGSGKFGSILSTVGEIAPLAYNMARGFEKPEKTVRRNIKPELLNYSDVSDPARNQAKNMYNDETNSIRNMTGGNAGAYLANQSVSKSRQYERMNEINNNEAARKMDITAKNIDLKNNAQMTNLNLDNQYDDLDLRNKARRDDMMATAMGNLSDYSQKKTKAANEEKSDNIKIAFTGQMYKDFELDTNEDGTPKYKDGIPQMRHKTEKKRMGTKSINTKYKVKC